jgi:hypothetical protein
MGCLPGNTVELQIAPLEIFGLTVPICHSCETAKEIEVELIKLRFNDQSKYQCLLIGNKYRKTSVFNQLTGLNQQVRVSWNHC